MFINPYEYCNASVFFEGDVDVLGGSLWSRRDFVQIETLYNDKPLRLLGLHIQASFLVPMKDKNKNPLPMVTQLDKADGLIRTELFRLCQARKVREIVDLWSVLFFV